MFGRVRLFVDNYLKYITSYGGGVAENFTALRKVVDSSHLFGISAVILMNDKGGQDFKADA